MIRTLFVEKKTGYDTVRRRKQAEIESALSIKTEMRMLIRYNIEGLDGDDFERAKLTIFSEPPVDEVYEEEVDLSGYTVIGVELLPGATPCQTSCRYRSLTGTGYASPVEDPSEKCRALSAILAQQTGEDAVFTEAMAQSVAVFRIRVDSLSGKARL